MVRRAVVPKPPVVPLGIGLQALQGIWAVVCGVVRQYVFKCAFKPPAATFDAVRGTIRHYDTPRPRDRANLPCTTHFRPLDRSARIGFLHLSRPEGLPP
jgi:hypothetical protein